MNTQASAGISKDYSVREVDIDSIYSDDEFNCRGPISPLDVADLIDDIRARGLLQPILLQPGSDVSEMPKDYDFRIVAGHRRFKAWQILKSQDKKYQYIPALIKVGLDEVTARVLNLGENLKRKELNILQEAKALKKLYLLGMPRDSTASIIGKSSGWVQTRYNLLSLPEEVQQEAAAGIINQHFIKQLYSLRKDPEKIFAAVKKLKKAKANGEKIGHLNPKKKSTKEKKEQPADKLMAMSELIAKSVGYGLTTRALAWAAGNISADEFFENIKETNPDFVFPKEL